MNAPLGSFQLQAETWTSASGSAVKTLVRCTHDHPRLEGRICNHLLMVVPLEKVEAIAGVEIKCPGCGEKTVFA